VLGWLRDIAANGERFRQLQELGRHRIRRKIDELRKSAGSLEEELARLREQIEARIQELTRTRTEAVRASIEKSIAGLEEQRKEADERRALVNHTISELKGLVSDDADLFFEYRNRIHDLLRNDENDLKSGLPALVSSLVLEETGIKIALAGVNRTGLGSSVFVSARGSKQQANNRPALIAGNIQLPSLVQLRSKSYIEQLYLNQHLSIREIAHRTDVSHSVVLEAMKRFGIPQNGNGHKHPGQIPFGYEYTDYHLVKNKSEQEVIRMIRQFRASGLSLWKIAGELNRRLIPTKNSGIWQANTVRKILART
jgi:hypothetical protein